jgi:hypothetical protein
MGEVDDPAHAEDQRQAGRGVMRDYRYVDGASVQPPDEVVARLRPADR